MRKSGIIHAHRGCVNALSFTPCGEMLLSSGDDTELCVWAWGRDYGSEAYAAIDPGVQAEAEAAAGVPPAELSTWTPTSEGRDEAGVRDTPLVRLETGHTANVFRALQVVPGSILPVAGDGRAKLHLLRPDGTAESVTLAQLDSRLHGAVVLGPTVVGVSGGDGTVALYDVRAGSRARVGEWVFAGGGAVHDLDVHPQGGVLACSVPDTPAVALLDVRRMRTDGGATEGGEGSVVKLLHVGQSDPAAEPTGVQFSWDGTQILTTLNDDYVYTLDPSWVVGNGNGGEEEDSPVVQKFVGARNRETIKGVTYVGQNSEFVASGSDCGSMFIWETKTGTLVNILEEADNYVLNAIAAHPSGAPVLASSGIEHVVKLWSPDWSSLRFDRNSERVATILARNQSPATTSSFGLPDPFELLGIDMDAALLQLLFGIQQYRSDDEAYRSDDEAIHSDDEPFYRIDREPSHRSDRVQAYDSDGEPLYGSDGEPLSADEAIYASDVEWGGEEAGNGEGDGDAGEEER